jgi:hypothetical protein
MSDSAEPGRDDDETMPAWRYDGEWRRITIAVRDDEPLYVGFRQGDPWFDPFPEGDRVQRVIVSEHETDTERWLIQWWSWTVPYLIDVHGFPALLEIMGKLASIVAASRP